MRVSSLRTTSRWGYDLTTTIYYCCNPSCQNRPAFSPCQGYETLYFYKLLFPAVLGGMVNFFMAVKKTTGPILTIFGQYKRVIEVVIVCD